MKREIYEAALEGITNCLDDQGNEYLDVNGVHEEAIRSSLQLAINLQPKPISAAPKNEVLFVHYNHDSDPYYNYHTKTFTDYGAHAEYSCLTGTGFCYATYVEGYMDQDGWESSPYWVPPCWFVVNGDEVTDIAVNPTHFYDISKLPNL